MKRLGFVLVIMLALTTIAGAQAWTFTDVSSIVTGELPTFAGSLAWSDMDNDGDLDLFVGGSGANDSYLYMNDGGDFVDVSETLGLRNYSTEDVRKAEWVDYNGDGLMDLSLVKENTWGVQLLTQQSNGQFISRRAIPDQTFTDPVLDAVWTDVDHDGDLDLITSSGPVVAPTMTVFAQSASQFVAMRDNPFTDGLQNVSTMTMCDYDCDGDLDLFLGNTGTAGSAAHFFVNNGNGSYRDYARHYGLPTNLGATGVVWADFNNDQRLDLFVPNLADTAALYRNSLRGSRISLDRTTAEGLTTLPLNIRYAHAVDVNRDGWMDLFVVRALSKGTSLMLNVGGQYWYDIAPQLGLTHRYFDTKACAWGDFDNDGDLDLAVALGSAGIRIYRNDLRPATNWSKFNLVSSDNNPLTGCNVRVQINDEHYIACNGPELSSTGCDDPRITFVYRDKDHKISTFNADVLWPNGVLSHYDFDPAEFGGIIPLTEPEAPTVTSPDSPQASVQTAVEATISPNPFNPTTTVSFTLPDAAEVQLEVFNLMGQKVATLANGPYAAGTHRLSFDGSRLPSGIYLSRLSAGNTTRLSRMLLVK